MDDKPTNQQPTEPRTIELEGRVGIAEVNMQIPLGGGRVLPFATTHVVLLREDQVGELGSLICKELGWTRTGADGNLAPNIPDKAKIRIKVEVLEESETPKPSLIVLPR